MVGTSRPVRGCVVELFPRTLPISTSSKEGVLVTKPIPNVKAVGKGEKKSMKLHIRTLHRIRTVLNIMILFNVLSLSNNSIFKAN